MKTASDLRLGDGIGVMANAGAGRQDRVVALSGRDLDDATPDKLSDAVGERAAHIEWRAEASPVPAVKVAAALCLEERPGHYIGTYAELPLQLSGRSSC